MPGVGYIKAKKSVQGPAIFAGIPYAAPPVGDGRWANPRPAPPLLQNGQYYDATHPRPACPQLCSLNQPLPKYTCPKKVGEVLRICGFCLGLIDEALGCNAIMHDAVMSSNFLQLTNKIWQSVQTEKNVQLA